MTDPQHHEALRELVARGLIADQPAPLLLACGNLDRSESSRRSSWRVRLPDGDEAKLTLGRGLQEVTNRHTALAQACPGIVTTPLFQVSLRQEEAMAETFFAGVSLATALHEKRFPSAKIVGAVAHIQATLAASEQASTESARRAEWQSWCDRLTALALWQSAERDILQGSLLPALYPYLSAHPPTTRWTNGDFLPGNILLNDAGEVRLIDPEFAARTHFFAEDAVRFQVLSSDAHDHPELAAIVPPESDLAWHLYFWLRQLHLEAGQNTAAYLNRVKTNRLGLIRRLAKFALGLELSGWSVPPLMAEYKIEDIRWSTDSADTVVITGWFHASSATCLRAINAQSSNARLAATGPNERPDVQRYHENEARALLSGFALNIRPMPGNFPLMLCAVIDQGTVLPFQMLTADDLPCGALGWKDYSAWATRHDPDPTASASAQSELLLSVLLPVYKSQEAHLLACIASVQAQHHPHWELCLVDDGSATPTLTAILNRLAAADARIRLQTRASNGGISRATNDALAIARGEFVVLLDHDDVLRPHALSQIAQRLAREPTLDALYSDEDKITNDGRPLIPFLKPDYSPEFLLGVMYVGHVLCIRTSVARATGGFDPAYDGIQDYEFFLRVTEKTGRIGHIPRILYHWRQSPGSSALHGNIKGDMDQRQAKAVQAHLERRGDRRTARPCGGHRIQLENPATPTVAKISASSPSEPLTALRRAASTSTAEVLVIVPDGAGEISKACLMELAALAALPDSGCVAPVLLSAENRVAESGRIGSVPIMRGFHSGSDGYHGTLRCNREVDAVSPACIAVRRALVADSAEITGENWPGFCAHLRSRGLYHRVCALVRVQLSAPPTDNFCPTPASREFYNPQFDAQNGDYTLGTTDHSQGSAKSGIQFYVDQPKERDSLPRCLISRGWCFAGPGSTVTAIRLKCGILTLNGVVGLPRPDVKVALPAAPDDNTGFEIRGTLPSGRNQLYIEARLSDGTWCLVFERTFNVKRQILPLWLGGGDWMELMFFQMPAHMAYAARPVRLEKFPTPSNLPKPKISVVTPSYNQARFLPETMRSVLEQSGVTCDYVVQDGGSTDESAEIIRRFASAGVSSKEQGAGKTEPVPQPSTFNLQLSTSGAPRLTAWESAPDHGQADAIVKGFAKTSGAPDDIMAWINSDDFYLPGALAFVADYFVRHPEVDVIYGHRIVVNESAQEIARWFLPKHDPAVLRLNDFVPQETLFWRRRIWDRAGGLDPSFKFAMDWDLLLRFQLAGAKIVRVPYFLACFRVHAAQKTSAQMHDVGQREITLLRERTHGRPFPPQELEQNPILLRYLRRSAFIEFLWRLRLRMP